MRLSRSVRSAARRASIAGPPAPTPRRSRGSVGRAGTRRSRRPARACRQSRDCSAARSSTLGVGDFVGELGQPPEVVGPALLPGDAQVLEPELLEPILRRLQALLVLLDLLVDEAHRRPRVLALVAEARLDEDRQQRLHDLARLLRIGVAVGDRVDVGVLRARARAARELQRLASRRRSAPRVPHSDVMPRSRSAMRTSFSTLGRLISVRLISTTCCSRLGWMDRPSISGRNSDCVST